MGQCWSQTKYSCDKHILGHEDAWSNWESHKARRYYKVGALLGKGAFSQVHAAVQLDTGKRVALKVIFLDNPRLEAEHVEVLRNEVALMRQLSHPNIVQLDCAIEDRARKQMVIAEDICLGGSLTEEIQAAEAVPTEDKCCNDDRMLIVIFRQLFKALEHMHSRHVLHRDIKPENIVFRYPHKDWKRKGALPVLIDFGMAARYQPDQPICGLMGSPGYVSPEVVLQQPHTPALDLFSMGVTLYVAITGHRPMKTKQANSLSYASVEAGDYPNMQGDQLWQAAAPGLRSLILGLLERDPAKRLTATQALQHPWLNQDMRVARPVTRAAEADTAVKRTRLHNATVQQHVEDFMQILLQAADRKSRPQQIPSRRRESAHTSTFFKTLWDEARSGPASQGVQSAELDARSIERPWLQAAQQPRSDEAPNGGEISAAPVATAGAAKSGDEQVAVEEHLLRHLRLTKSMQRGRVAATAPTRSRSRTRMHSAARRRTRERSAPVNDAAGVSRAQAAADLCAEPLLETHTTGSVALTPEMQRHKARAEVEWCARRWRSAARRMLEPERGLEADAADRLHVTKVLGKVGSVAVRALQEGDASDDSA